MSDDYLESFLDRGGYYDYDGNEITLREWAPLVENRRTDPNGPWLVARTADMDHAVTVSTVWIGIDLGFHLSRAPLIYETMVFRDETVDDEYTRRYATRTEAGDGHAEVCRVVFPVLEFPASGRWQDHHDPRGGNQ